MTLLDEIQAKSSTALLAAHDYQAIADVVNVGRVKLVERLGGIGTIMNALGPDGGAALLDQLETVATTSSAVKWGMKLIIDGTFDFGLQSSRSMIDQLVPEPARSALKALAEVPDPVSALRIATVMTGGE